jgi:ABC-type polysaccharide/polyol phosphate transport system ATPase subunit
VSSGWRRSVGAVRSSPKSSDSAPAAPVIECRGVVKRFYAYEHRTTTLQELVRRVILRQPIHVRTPQFHLDGFDVSIAAGESVALIGANGSGKSTALRLIAGVYPPTQGVVRTTGRLVAVIELGATFQPDLTGLENLHLYASALGLSRRSVHARLAEMVAFSGVESFIDVPLKYYSSGMRARLAFTIALYAEPDTLLLDEVLAVGDAEFKAKCLDRLQRFRDAGGTMVMVSHDMDSVRRMCTRAIWLDHGRVRMSGPVDLVVSAYETASPAAESAG